MQYCADNNDDSPFISESTELVTNNDGNNTEAPNSYTAVRNENEERVTTWNDDHIETYSTENDFLITKLQTKDGKTYTYEYNDDGSYTKTKSDGTQFGYNTNGECISRKDTDGTSYTFQYNADKSYSSYNADTNTWNSSWHADNSRMGEMTAKGNYRFNPASEISIADAAAMLGVDEAALRDANPKASRAGKFTPPNNIYIPKSSLPEDFDPSKVIV